MPPYMMAYIINFAKLFFGNTLEFIETPSKNPRIEISLSFWWKKYFKLMQRDVNTRFNELNNKLDKKINIPYYIKGTDTTLIENEFIELLNYTRTLYEASNEIVNCKDINTLDLKANFSEINVVYFTFIKVLNESQNKEIKDAIPKDLLAPLSLPIISMAPGFC